MKVTRVSMYSGVERTFDLNITKEQMDMYNKGILAQNAFPNLSRDEREFIISGITAEEWDEITIAANEEDDIADNQCIF
jgi:hypothetical protein